MRSDELMLLKRAVMILCRNIQWDNDIGHLGTLDHEDTYALKEIYHSLASVKDDKNVREVFDYAKTRNTV